VRRLGRGRGAMGWGYLYNMENDLRLFAREGTERGEERRYQGSTK
jgi:hypothetical protein